MFLIDGDRRVLDALGIVVRAGGGGDPAVREAARRAIGKINSGRRSRYTVS